MFHVLRLHAQETLPGKDKGAGKSSQKDKAEEVPEGENDEEDDEAQSAQVR